VTRLARALGDAIGRNGGGVAGLWQVLLKTVRMARVLGVAGLMRRIRAASGRTELARVSPPSRFEFPPPVPLAELRLKVGVMVHVFYPDLLEDIAQALSNMPVPFELMVSVVDDEAHRRASSVLSRVARVARLDIRVVENRGRDIAPFLVTFREEIAALDIVCHLHTKKSLYTGSELGDWRTYLFQSLLGSPARVAWILGSMQATPRLGLVYPESHACVPLAGHTWLGNVHAGRVLGEQLGIEIDPGAYLDFPAGSMFWARVDAIRPLLDLGLVTASFPPEQGQTDGALQHALERMFGQVALARGMLLGILPADGSLRLSTESNRNWREYFETRIDDLVSLRAMGARVVSFDIFDTLVTRAFLTPSAARAYLAWRARTKLGIDGFASMRIRAEEQARARGRKDPNLSEVYDALAKLPGIGHTLAGDMRTLELETEARLLRPRAGMVDVASRLRRAGKRVLAISDMYFAPDDLARILPPDAASAVETLLVSNETGLRKDSGDAWRELPKRLAETPSRWLHVGDNEHSDVQLPNGMGFIPPVHVLRPASLLEVVPALRPLRPGAASATGWHDALWLGLVANRFARIADVSPEAFGESIRIEAPADLGYVVLGPLVLDFLAWAGRLSLAEGFDKILFLSREGWLLEGAFREIQAFVPALQQIECAYFLSSRRAAGAAMLRSAEDLAHVFEGAFTGTLGQLIATRLGDDIARLVGARLGADTLRKQVFLPEMQRQVVAKLDAASEQILAASQREREAYLDYWKRETEERRVLLADVGYAGTIQAHLSRLAAAPLFGAYFALNARAGQTGLHGGWAKARYHDAREQPSEASPIVQHDLLLESMLTAPHPQFSHMAPRAEPRFASGAAVDFTDLRAVHEGAEEFIRDIGAAVGSDTLELDCDRALVQAPLRCLGTGLWRAGAWSSRLTAEDAFTGRGGVDVFHPNR
jgi:FMN phosphatase YigB (HAD superfamily)